MTDPRESDVCDAFAVIAQRHGWTVYPETGGWDLLLVNGDQIGVQAKVRANLAVIQQALPGPYAMTAVGPHFRAILTADGMELDPICRPLRLLRFSLLFMDRREPMEFGTNMLTDATAREPYRWQTVRPVALPCVVPMHSGGCPSPLVLSRWKIGALRVLARCQLRGWVTTADGQDCNHDMGYMIRTGMLVRIGMDGRRIKYQVGEHRKRPDRQHPQEFAQIVEQERAAVGKAKVTP